MTTVNSNPNRVLRGGSWVSLAGFCRSAYRGCGEPGYRGWSIGFRPVLKPNPNRVLRGGSWYSFARNCRSAYRCCVGPGIRGQSFGFRLVLKPIDPQ